MEVYYVFLLLLPYFILNRLVYVRIWQVGAPRLRAG